MTNYGTPVDSFMPPIPKWYQVPTPGAGFLGLINQANEFAKMQRTFEAVADGIARKSVLDRISSQLPSGQSVDVLITKHAPMDYSIDRIDRPGSPRSIIQPAKDEEGSHSQWIVLRGPPEEKCYPPGKEPQTKAFLADGINHTDRIIILDEGVNREIRGSGALIDVRDLQKATNGPDKPPEKGISIKRPIGFP